MSHVTDPGAGAIESTYHADFTMGEHSAWHLRRILHLYLTA